MVIKNRIKTCLIVSAAIMLTALIMTLLGYGINFGIDFAGGLSIEYNMNSTFEQSDVEDALRNQGVTDYKVTTSGTDGTSLNIRIPKLDSNEEIQVLQARHRGRAACEVSRYGYR